MNNCTPNDTKNVRSLYFVVKDEIIIPKPKLKPASKRSKIGISACSGVN